MFKLLFYSISLLGLLSCGQQAEEDGFAYSAGGNITAWSTSQFPLDIKVSTAFSSAEVTAVGDMLDEWELAAENQIDFFGGVSSTTNLIYTNESSYNDGVIGVYSLSTSWPSEWSTNALAVTQIFGFRRGADIEISHGDILFNTYTHTFSTDPTDFGKYDFHSVTLHEIGHLLGLGHTSTEFDSVMHPSISQIEANRTAGNTDKANITTNYGLPSSFSSFGSLTAESGVSIAAGLNLDNTQGEIRIVIQLMADGECEHYSNGELYHSHKVESSLKIEKKD